LPSVWLMLRLKRSRRIWRLSLSLLSKEVS